MIKFIVITSFCNAVAIPQLSEVNPFILILWVANLAVLVLSSGELFDD